ncbi:hypothetical protein Q5P01_011611 [Channa striata]|uniref:Uncharacterized protein n=1 Tax=Channa striata TaxID=64152 RepID=A0AA88MZR3_CHASR|nr:hypothetical protein Q5P01_011611 [Channa striata]
MKRTDLLQRLAESTSGLRALESSNEAFEVKTTEKDKDEFPSALIQKQVEAMTSVIELLLEALADLSDIEIEDLKRLMLSQIDRYKPSSDTIWKWLQLRTKGDIFSRCTSLCTDPESSNNGSC